jgi:hypothetical protein
MTTKTKLIKTVYLYLVAAVSLLFVAIGSGILLNTGLKFYLFPDAEKKSYFECSNPPPTSSIPSREGATDEQKAQLDALLKDYENWKENSMGEKCIKPARQNKLVDAITMVIIALPICLFHWRLIKKEKEEKEENNNESI